MVDVDSATTAIGIEEYETQLHLKRKIRSLCKYQDMQIMTKKGYQMLPNTRN